MLEDGHMVKTEFLCKGEVDFTHEGLLVKVKKRLQLQTEAGHSQKHQRVTTELAQ